MGDMDAAHADPKRPPNGLVLGGWHQPPFLSLALNEGTCQYPTPSNTRPPLPCHLHDLRVAKTGFLVYEYRNPPTTAWDAKRKVWCMARDFIDDLLQALERVIPPDRMGLKEVLIVSGMPEATENLRYLGFNRQTVDDGDRTLEFSAVAVINNRRIPQWRLSGFRMQLSRLIFSSHWTRNPLDLFLNNLRCNAALMDLMARLRPNYALLGILQVDTAEGQGVNRRVLRRVRPVLALPGLDEERLKQVISFENVNEISKVKLSPFPLYSKQ